MTAQRHITRTQVEIYAEFDGDTDMYQRRRRSDPEMSWDTWAKIDDLRRRLYIVAAGQASEKFKAAALADIDTWISDLDARRIILELVDKDVRAQSAKV